MLRTIFNPATLAVPAVALALLAGCAEPEKYVERPVDELYNTAMTLMEKEDYRDAAKYFDEVERQHPYSIWATKAQLMAAYAQYQRNQYDEAIIALDRFIQLHPGSPDIAYAYYLKALSHYEQISDVERDQQMTEQALETLKEIINRFPNSRYARDAKVKMDLAVDHLAGKEMEIGRYYMKRSNWLAAVNRFKVVAEKYQTTSHVPEALHRMAEAYTALGLTDEARRIGSVLGYNYPGNEWYMDSYEMIEEKQVRPKKAEKPWYKVW
ncbi:MAG: outer membrane protein assembly factor BamD [Alphaproteobacteria bacterium]|nr:outer membrane protein assembly factor BamD [Alphaproteobacteria bacterium]